MLLMIPADRHSGICTFKEFLSLVDLLDLGICIFKAFFGPSCSPDFHLLLMGGFETFGKRIMLKREDILVSQLGNFVATNIDVLKAIFYLWVCLALGSISMKIDLERILLRSSSSDPLIIALLFLIGNLDAGKSTIGGQILLLSGQVDDRTIQKYEKEAKDKNRESW
ncbi:hypothetical protein HAX54_023769 [Datura stramonium]|uniref:Tr-type G domain-containing protein n=1 Tax=Datura stramonium TaxID=4076 RepID=A0ABS8UXJ2_DATST|nr:hypothetical protein [Datura stramonium]